MAPLSPLQSVPVSHAPLAVSQHTEQEWDEVRPIIERLYLQNLRPLSTVIEIMETRHQFKASVAMYKRKLRRWNLRKNNMFRAQSDNAAAREVKGGGAPRYLAQNDLDEAFHTLLDLFVPWVTQARFFWSRAGRLHCPPRALFIYDPFTQDIALAAVAFESGDTARGGDLMRRAFVHMEHTLAPRSRSSYTLPSLFFALATLNLAGLHEAARMLVIHAAKLVLARAPATDGKEGQALFRLRPEMAPEVDNGELDHHSSHPFPQIIHRLRILHLNGNGAMMSQAIFHAWSVYQQECSSELAGAIAVGASTKGFWNTALRSIDYPTSDISGGLTGWTDSMQPVLHCLAKLLQSASDTGVDDDLALLNLEEIVSVYSFSNDKRFEKAALELIAKIEGKDGTTTVRAQRRAVATLELARFYAERADLENTTESFARIVPDTMGTEWKDILNTEFDCWIEEIAPV